MKEASAKKILDKWCTKKREKGEKMKDGGGLNQKNKGKY